MLLALFTWLTQALSGNVLVAVTASFIWGILSIILSPCHLASIPVIVGFIDEQGKLSTRRAFFLSALFSFGILITIALVGMVTGLMGRILGDIGPYGNYAVAILFFVVGLHLLGIIPMPFAGKAGQPVFNKKGLFAAFILGLVFGVALGPCTFAFMMPILGVAFSVGVTNLLLAISLILAYALGHVSVIILAGTFTEIVQNYLNWNEKSKRIMIVKKVCGVLVFLGGIYLVYTVKK